MCGEKKVMRGAKDKRMGSPPHVRGKAQEWMAEGKAERITPACAGKSFCLFFDNSFFWDHPRMCGEKTERGCKNGSYQGSPPHVRGKD